ncbi:carboxymuconolactone decarboxylase family protein [Muricoccus radiodurans]|uniref:carboxymuconolactone decarboxylase family protein n=1 Tax=Muricoccus radiodurans TaxID=2231721 RepID=UPI003CF11D57
MPRIPLPGPEEMTPEQRRVYDGIVSGPRGVLIGPLRAGIHSPDIAERWSKLGESLRFNTVLPKRLNELAICVTGRRYTAQIEWWVHAKAAGEAGIPADVLESIRTNEAPSFADPEEALIYEFARQIHLTGTVPDETYNAVVARWGARGAVELTAVIGYYVLVSMTLNVHDIPLPDGVPAPLAPPPGGGLAPLPPARA